MAALWVCDGCGTTAPGVVAGMPRQWFKPGKWFSRADEDGIQDACSRQCIDTIAARTGKTREVMPL